jgi:acyl dehydratase
MAATRIPGISALRDFVGKPLGSSDWTPVTQERIDRFAEATGDRQWIHVDPERARRESPFHAPVAHGFLSLSLAPALLAEIVQVEGEPTVLNTGLDKVRLSAPVPAGSRVRLRAEIKHVRDMPGGAGVHATFHLVLEVEGAEKPACTADMALVYLGPGATNG